MTTTAANLDPTLSEVEFLRSIVRQVRHTCNVTHEQGEFAIDPAEAVRRILAVCDAADARPSSDADVIAELRREIGNLQSRLINEGLTLKKFGAVTAALAESERMRSEQSAVVAALDARVAYYQKQIQAAPGGGRWVPAAADAEWLRWLAAQLALTAQYGGQLTIDLPATIARLSHLAGDPPPPPPASPGT